MHIKPVCAALMQAMPIRTTVLAKKELMYMGFWGLAAWLCGLVFVDRLNPETARSTMDRTVKHIQEANVSECFVSLVSAEE